MRLPTRQLASLSARVRRESCIGKRACSNFAQNKLFGDACFAGYATVKTNNFTVEWLATHFESIWFQAFLSPQQENVTYGQMIIWYFNLPKRAKNRILWLIACGTEVVLDTNLVCFRPFLPFLPRPEGQSQQFNPNRIIFARHITSSECREKNLSPWITEDLMDIFAPPFIRESANRAK